MEERTSVVFFGSGPVALESLRLLAKHFDLEAIITKPATENLMRRSFPSTPVFAVQNRKELDSLCLEQAFHSGLGILIDFGIIVSQLVIDSFQLGIINSHFSLLPEWRGADPITFAVLSGQRQTGVSLMLLVTAMDEGPLLAQSPYTIPASVTTPELTHDLIQLSDVLLTEIVPQYVHGRIEPQDQLTATIGPKRPSYSRKLTKEDGKLDWTKPAKVLEREVRAYIEWPHSYAVLGSKDIIVTAAKADVTAGSPGTVKIDRHRLLVCCGEGALEILKLKPASKPEMSARAFLAGYGKLL